MLQLVTPERAKALLEDGRAIPVGSRKRVRALIVTFGSDEFLRAARPPRCHPDTHRHETDDNPPGVWTFRKLHWSKEVI
jgi:hypothetical protein